MAYLEAASSHRIFLEDAQSDLPYSLDAAARRWPVHGLADQDISLSIGSAYESTSGIFAMDDHADDASPESASRFARLHDDAFS